MYSRQLYNDVLCTDKIIECNQQFAECVLLVFVCVLQTTYCNRYSQKGNSDYVMRFLYKLIL